MRKNEILKLIEAYKTINKNKSLVSMTIDKKFKILSIDKKQWFPKIAELEKEFNTLEKEIECALNETNHCKNIIENSNCNHEIRLKYKGLISDYSTCVLCDKIIYDNKCVNFEYSINRNKYCIDLIAKYQDDEDYDDVLNGYTDEQVHKIIINILKDKKNDEEIDLVHEFKKLNLPNCIINEEKKVIENYILIIGGSNKQFIDNESYLYKNSLNIGVDFLKYFYGFLNTRIELIDNSTLLESANFKNAFSKENRNLKLIKYDTILELEKILSSQKEIPFKIIIDLSELYEYKISDNVISKEVYNLKLSEYFKNSHIIRINNLSRYSLKQLEEYLKKTENLNNSYAYRDNKYYYMKMIKYYLII